MKTDFYNEIFNRLNLSKDDLLNEIALLSAYQKLSEFEMEVEYFGRKYQESFSSFNNKMEKQQANYETENDWLAWKFAEEGKNYWASFLKETKS
jgi:vacuolar-type H+-ATPase subunit I/STV1